VQNVRKIEPRKKASQIDANDNEETKQDKTEFNAVNEVSSYLSRVDKNRKNSAVPRPPKPGEVMYCQYCGKPMLPKDFSTDERTRRREFKWQIHQACMNIMDDLADRSTPGLLAERNRKY
jgi:hypothetical protein